MSEKKLLHLLRQKKGYFEAILDLTQEENALAVPDWITSLKQKRILLSCIDEIDQEIQSYQSYFTNLSQHITDELDQTRDIVGKIMRLNNLNFKQRKQQLDESP